MVPVSKASLPLPASSSAAPAAPEAPDGFQAAPAAPAAPASPSCASDGTQSYVVPDDLDMANHPDPEEDTGSGEEEEPVHLSVRDRMCLNGSVVPVEEATCTWVDPYNLVSELREHLPVRLVAFKKILGNDMRWLQQEMNLPRTRTMASKFLNMPLFWDVRDLIEKKKNKKSRMPKRHTSLVPLEIRGRVLWFMNNHNVVTLALHGPSANEDLQFFIRELQQDLILYMIGNGQHGINVLPRRQAKSAVPEDLKAPVKEALDVLMTYQKCQKARYCFHRNQIVVRRAPDGTRGTFTVKGMHRERNKVLVTSGEVGDIERTFKLATLQAIAFLGGPHAVESGDESQDDQHAPGGGGAPPGDGSD